MERSSYWSSAPMEVEGVDAASKHEHVTEDELPSHLNTLDTRFLEVSKEKLTVKYIGKGSHSHDVGSIRANKPFPTTQMIAYYEILVVDAGVRGSICIGLADKDFTLNRQPGWEDNSFGYCGEDGRKYTEGMKGDAYAEPFTTGDIVGCGIHFGKQEIFYTKNGKYLGVAFKKVRGTLYPTVGLHSVGEIVAVNFGPAVKQKPFKFDIEAMIQEQKQKMMNEVMSFTVHVGDVNSIIRNYLLYYGYEDTLKSFETACGGMKSELAHNSLQNRKNVRKLILSGQIEEALRMITALYPDIMKLFIEMIKRGNIDDAILCAQTSLSEFRSKLNEADEKFLQDVLGLLAYTNLENSPLGHLLQLQQRETVADAINKSILELEHVPKSQSTLERLLRQLSTCHAVLKEESGSGVQFDLKEYLK